MIKAGHHPFYVWFFRHYSRWMIRSHFRQVIIEGDTEKTDAPLLVISNHFSWWDGFFINHLNHKLWQKKFHVMMLEEQLSNRKFLSRAGAFSIKRGNRSALESMHYAKNLLTNPENLLLMYPQGEFNSLAYRPVKFEKGIEDLLEKNEISVKMVVALIDYFSHRKPSLFLYIKDFENNTEHLEAAFNNFLEACVKKQNLKATNDN
ncbi:MAG: lysophospholipid acyltransferase family protein [Marinilabiliaceae bacterium]